MRGGGRQGETGSSRGWGVRGKGGKENEGAMGARQAEGGKRERRGRETSMAANNVKVVPVAVAGRDEPRLLAAHLPAALPLSTGFLSHPSQSTPLAAPLMPAATLLTPCERRPAPGEYRPSHGTRQATSAGVGSPCRCLRSAEPPMLSRSPWPSHPTVRFRIWAYERSSGGAERGASRGARVRGARGLPCPLLVSPTVSTCCVSSEGSARAQGGGGDERNRSGSVAEKGRGCGTRVGMGRRGHERSKDSKDL